MKYYFLYGLSCGGFGWEMSRTFDTEQEAIEARNEFGKQEGVTVGDVFSCKA